MRRGFYHLESFQDTRSVIVDLKLGVLGFCLVFPRDSKIVVRKKGWDKL